MATNDSWQLSELQDFINEAGDFHSPGFPDTLLAYWINCAIQAWADWVLANDDTRFMKEGTISVSSGTDSYDLKDSGILSADDYYRARGFCVADSNSPSGYTRLQRFEWVQRHDYSYSTHKLCAHWDVMGDDLLIWPKPSWSDTCLLEYVPLPAKLVNAGDTVDLRGNVEFIATYVLVRLCNKDESSKKAWQDAHAEVKLQMRQASPQNRAQPKRLVSVYGDRGKFKSLRRRQWRIS